MMDRDLTALVASRICHDLISPIGAIGNGLELIQLSCGTSPELDLINTSVTHARARIRLFRLAFGAGNGQLIDNRDIQGMLQDLGNGTRITYRWSVAEAAPRAEIKAALLALLCVETALPRGGTVGAQFSGGHWRISGEGAALRVDPAAFGVLSEETDGSSITPAGIQFLLLPAAAKAIGRTLNVVRTGETALGISF